MNKLIDIRKVIDHLSQFRDSEVAPSDQRQLYHKLESLAAELSEFGGEAEAVVFRPLLSVLHSVLAERNRQLDPERIRAALGVMREMLDNIASGAKALNDEIQQDFFERWFTMRGEEGEEENDYEPSSVDYLAEQDSDDDADIERFFVIEAQETLSRMRFFVGELSSSKNWRDVLEELRALMHSLKGSSSIVNDKCISGLAHEVEEILRLPEQRPSQAFTTLFERLCDTFAWLVQHMHEDDSVRRGKVDAISLALKRYQQSATLDEEAIDLAPTAKSQEALETRQPLQAVSLEKLAVLMEKADASRMVMLEDLRQLRSIGQSMQHSSQALEDFFSSNRDLQRALKRRGQKQQSATIKAREVFRDLEEYFRIFEQRMEGAQDGMDKLQEVSARLWREIAKSRRIPIGRMFGILQKTVKELAHEQGVEVALKTEGADILVEKKVFETLFDPLVQMIRNALSHGVETVEERRRLNKSVCANLRVSFSTEVDDLLIEVADDGRGIVFNEILATAKEYGFVEGDSAAALEELIFVSGLTTKREIDEFAGRGIGMDVVKRGINKLNGIVQVDSEPGVGTTFKIRIPSSRFYATVYVVRALGSLFVIPTALVAATENDPFFSREGYDVASLSEILGGRPSIRPRLLVGGVEQRFYLEVDEIIGRQHVVMNKLGRFFKNLELIWGATHIKDGEMAFVLNTREIADLWKVVSQQKSRKPSRPNRSRLKQSSVQILVVDDSISVREFLKITLRNRGYSVQTANDGLEALKLLERQRFGLIITDLEMPGMDGYELIERLRHSMDESIPLMIVTSRPVEEEGERARSLGVGAYLRKPCKPPELLKKVAQLLEGD